VFSPGAGLSDTCILSSSATNCKAPNIALCSAFELLQFTCRCYRTQAGSDVQTQPTQITWHIQTPTIALLWFYRLPADLPSSIGNFIKCILFLFILLFSIMLLCLALFFGLTMPIIFYLKHARLDSLHFDFFMQS